MQPSPAAARASSRHVRNPGPSWGLPLVGWLDRTLPTWMFRTAVNVGVWGSLACMPAQRRHSRDYLAVVFGRAPTWREVHRHFLAFTDSLLSKLRAANGVPHRGVLAPGSDYFQRFIDSGDDALMGTFHFGDSDIVGYLWGGQEKRRVTMVRQRVANSHDTDELGRMFGQWVTFLWVNDGDNLLLALKDAAAAGGSLAMKCDRIEFSARTEPFQFLGARRLFPFTIYYLSIIFKLPVVFSIGVPGGPGETIVHSVPRWDAEPALSRAANLESARAHFQGFLALVEQILRGNPYLWFNFLPLNPVVPGPAR